MRAHAICEGKERLDLLVRTMPVKGLSVRPCDRNILQP
jgi:hypothetical protein